MRLGLAALAVALASPAGAAVTLRATTPFEVVGPLDAVVLRVDVQNDAQPRVLVLETRSPAPDSPVDARASLELAPGARKSVELVRLPFNGGSSVIEARDGELVLATAVVRVDRAHPEQRLLGVLGAAPAGLLRLEGGDPPCRVVEIDPSALPDDELRWPELAALVWLQPREAALDAEQARALARWVRTGGALIAGEAPDEPAALQRLGIADDRPDAGPAPPARVASGLGALVSLRRSGESLRELTEDECRTLLSLLDAAWREGADPDSPALPPSIRMTPLVPPVQRPLAPAGASGWIAFAFALCVGPLDIVLRRRDARRARGASRTAWRHGVLVATFTTAAFLLAHVAGGSPQPARRLDFVDADPATGAARAVTIVQFARARAGDVLVSVGSGATLDDCGADREGWGWRTWDPQRGRIHLAGAAMSDREEVVMKLASWEPGSVRVRWTPREGSAPRVRLEADGRILVDDVDAAVVMDPAEWEWPGPDQLSVGRKMLAEDAARRSGHAVTTVEAWMLERLASSQHRRTMDGKPALQAPPFLVTISRSRDAPAIDIAGVPPAESPTMLHRFPLPPRADGSRWVVAP